MVVCANDKLRRFVVDSHAIKISTSKKIEMLNTATKKTTKLASLFALTFALSSFAAVANAAEHVPACDKKEGVDKLRCERHVKMAAKCGSLKSDEHFACDREFLIANPLDCGKLSNKSADSCVAETKAFRTCEANPGRAFMKCVMKTTNESPMGH